jgi:hypothetical protein
MSNRRPLPLLSVASALALHPIASAKPDYNFEVRPILSDNCFACHGPDRENLKGGLRLDLPEAAFAPAKSGERAIIPGKPDSSTLIQRILSSDPDEVMPPPKSHKKLTASQIETLRQWISAGAEYQPHWAFIPPKSHTPPALPAPYTTPNPIDAFVRHRSLLAGLRPSPEAPRHTLLRRAALDLTGLPPTPEQTAAFLNDPQPDSFERAVDRLLASPHFGERMAVDWLDAARFADSNGYQVDRDRELWPWRDWVINAFNQNMPFDQFTLEQIAGDLLPNPTLQQRIATGFHRNHMLNEEGGVLADEFLAEYTADRVETTAAVWLGQTFNCARCHDHKYDPFTQKDFYSLKAFFHNVPENGVGQYGNNIRVNAPPFVRLPRPEVEARIATLKESAKQVGEQINALKANAARETLSWAQRLTTASVEWIQIHSATSSSDPTLHLDPTHPNSLKRSVKIAPQPTAHTAFRIQLTASGDRTVTVENLLVRLIHHEKSSGKPAPLALKGASAPDAIPAPEAEKAVSTAQKAKLSLTLAPQTPNTLVVEPETPIPQDKLGSLEIEITVVKPSSPLTVTLASTISDPRLLVPREVIDSANVPEPKRTAKDRQLLESTFLNRSIENRTLTAESERLRKQINDTELEIPTTLVMEEMKQPRPTHILLRGAYDRKGDAVTAATPAVLPPLPADAPKNRLGLARWLVDRSNPLTARVIVNRFWQMLFGNGIVRSSEDFGAQGDLPSHPQLLDWLAQDFMNSGWNVKRLLRQIVTSATYRQSSVISVDAAEKDPENRLLARAPRIRLPSESIRDQALAVSGSLVRTIGGPSVKPYHPQGLYEQITAGNGYNKYTAGKGSDLYRRSLYTYWKRSVPNPAMLVFDAPFRETCTLRRPRTNTPLQALNLMNDPTFVEASRMLGQRMILEGGPDPAHRISHGFKQLLIREPRPPEIERLAQSLEKYLAHFANDPAAAKALLDVGDTRPAPDIDPVQLAAYTALANILLTLDETITRQ